MFNQNISSNKFDLNLSTMLSSYWCTAKFQEITLPALRFEKVEETDTKKWKNDTEEKRRSNSKERRITRKKPTRKRRLKTTLQNQEHLL